MHGKSWPSGLAAGSMGRNWSGPHPEGDVPPPTSLRVAAGVMLLVTVTIAVAIVVGVFLLGQ